MLPFVLTMSHSKCGHPRDGIVRLGREAWAAEPEVPAAAVAGPPEGHVVAT